MRTLAMTTVVTAAFALTTWQLAKARESAAGFQIVVQKTDKGVALKCAQGCAWKTATWTCDRPSHNALGVIQNDSGKIYVRGIADCRFGVNEQGVGPAPEDP